MGTFQGGVAVDPNTGGLVAGATLDAFSDVTLATPVTLTFADASSGTSVTTSVIGAFLPFTTPDGTDQVWLVDSVTGYVNALWSFEGLVSTATAAQLAAEAAQAAAEAAGTPLPAGGSTGQALVKNSGADYDVEWATVSGGGTGGHVIVDEATPLTARTNLAFVGSAVAVTDSSGTDTTTVTISAAAATHQHAASDITSGTLAVARIPTGTTAGTVATGDHVHTSVDDLPDAAVLSVVKAGSWPARPTADADTVVMWIGADPAPSIVTSGTGGMYANDVHVVTA